MEHKRYVVAITTDLDNAKAHNKMPAVVFDTVKYHSNIGILPNNQIKTKCGTIFNIWNSYDAQSKARRRREVLNKIAEVDSI